MTTTILTTPGGPRMFARLTSFAAVLSGSSLLAQAGTAPPDQVGGLFTLIAGVVGLLLATVSTGVAVYSAVQRKRSAAADQVDREVLARAFEVLAREERQRGKKA